MKKYLLLFLLIGICSSNYAYGQKKLKAEENLALIDGKWKQDGDKVYVQRIIELDSMSKVVIFNKIQEFMATVYKDANEVLQVEDKENGLLVGKGNTVFYVNDIFAGSGIKQTVWHIFKAEVKDNRTRITISVSTINWSTNASTAAGVYISAKNGEFPITLCYPIGEDGSRKKRSGYVFYYAVSDIINLLDACEVYIKKSVETNINNDNW